MKYFLYNDMPPVAEPGGFEEASDAESAIRQILHERHTRVHDLRAADIAFIPVNNASGYYGGTDMVAVWRDKITPRLVRGDVPHVAVFSYVVNNINLDFIPDWVTIWAYESECSHHDRTDTLTTDSGCGDRMCVIPYSLSAQTNPAAGTVAATAIDPRNFDYDGWRSRRPCVFVGSAEAPSRPRISLRYSHVVRWSELTECDIFTDRASAEPNDKYAQYRFALVLRGDTPTRKAFYQALAAGAFPVVTDSAWQAYSELYRGDIGDLRKFVLVLPDDAARWDAAKITATIQTMVADAATLLPLMLQWVLQHLPYDQVVARAAAATIAKTAKRQVPLLFVHDLQPADTYRPRHATLGEYEIITPENIANSQYGAEHEVLAALMLYPHRTGVLAKASAAYVPVYPFMCAWRTPGFYNVRASAAAVAAALATLPEWRHSAVPHYITYADVLWDDDRVFLAHVDLPANTTVISLESSAHQVRQVAVPFPIGTRQVGIGDALAPRGLAVYVGRHRLPACQYKIDICEINTSGWHSSNSHDEPISVAYGTHMFSLQPHGDRVTRRGFYQSIAHRCVPVITADCVSAYSAAIGSDVSEFCVVLQEWPDDIRTVLSEAAYVSLAPRLPSVTTVGRALAQMGLAYQR